MCKIRKQGGSLGRLVLDILVISEEHIFNLLLGDLAQGPGVTGCGRFELETRVPAEMSEYDGAVMGRWIIGRR